MIVKPVIDEYLPQAQIAVDVFSKYKIFDSIDVCKGVNGSLVIPIYPKGHVKSGMTMVHYTL